VKVRLVTTPTKPGDHTYVITVPEQADETDKNNNRLEKLVHILDAKPVKVLYIEGYPRYEYRFIKSLLEREAVSKQGNKSIQFRSLLLDADRDFSIQDKSAIGEFPSRDALNAFDVIILGDIDPKHEKIGPRNLELLRDFVRERGGGMLFIAGEQNMPQSGARHPAGRRAAITWGGAGESEDADEKAILAAGLTNGYRPRLTAIGQQHPIFRFATDDGDNAAIWQELSPLYFAASGYKPKPASEVLATHPLLRARHGPGEADNDLHPLAVQVLSAADASCSSDSTKPGAGATASMRSVSINSGCRRPLFGTDQSRSRRNPLGQADTVSPQRPDSRNRPLSGTMCPRRRPRRRSECWSSACACAGGMKKPANHSRRRRCNWRKCRAAAQLTRRY